MPERGLELSSHGAWVTLNSYPLQVPPGGNKTQYEEISIPVALLSHRDLRDIFRVGGREGRGGHGLGSGCGS